MKKTWLVAVLIVAFSFPASSEAGWDWFANVMRRDSDEWASFDDFSGAADFDNPITRSFCISLVTRENQGYYNIGQVCDIFDGIEQRWVYVQDPSFLEHFARASETVTANLRGDCDDHALLMAAAIRAIGGSAAIILEGTTDEGHAWPMVYIGPTWVEAQVAIRYISKRYAPSDIMTLPYMSGIWLSLDWTANHPGGPRLIDAGDVVESFAIPIMDDRAILDPTAMTYPIDP